MLFKALQYFWVKFWGADDRGHITRISGETYWLYRIQLQLALTALAGLGFLGTEYLPSAREFPLANHIGLACAFSVVAVCELLRLRIQLREQRAFAALFYD